MKRFTSNKQEPYFSYIKSGIKNVEGRLNKGKWVEMQVGDQILVDNLPDTDETILVEIANKSVYKSFREMITFEGIKNVIPDAKSIDEAESAYYKFYSKEDETQFGVASFQVKLL